MAKILTVIADQPNVVIGGNLIVSKPGATTIMQTSNNNRPNVGGSTSKGGPRPTPKFGGMDQNITMLDATYDQNVNQAPWETYANNINGAWQLCANCQPGAGGKKLFRQVNFNRQLIGLPVNLTPDNDTEFAIYSGGSLTLIMDQPDKLDYAFYAPNNGNDACYLIPRIPNGKQMQPFFMDQYAEGEYDSGTALYQWANELQATFIGTVEDGAYHASIIVCPFQPSGAPGLQSGLEFEYDQQTGP